MSDYRASNFGRSSTSASSYANNQGYYQNGVSLWNVPRLSSTPKRVYFRVCQTYRNRDNFKDIYISEDNTLEQLKEQICRQFNLTTKSTDLVLSMFNENDRTWAPIYDTNVDKTIADLNFPSYPTINVEEREETNANQQHTSKIRNNDLKLKLCKRPMDKSDFIYLLTHSTITIGQLKEEAQKHVMTKKPNHLYLWTNDTWTKFETNLDDLTLAAIGFDQYSIISFGTENDPIPGVCGLTNLGNTCFMNSALQCLSNIPEFTRQILSFGNEMNAPIIGAYSTLIKTMWSGDHVATTPSSLLLNIREDLPRFSRYRQQDAQEFMNYFLHLIHQELTNEKTLITDLFYGRIQSSVRCLGGCRSIETNEETISFLPLPIENAVNQYSLLYLRSNGEQRLVSARTCARTIGTLIESFIEQHEPKLSPGRIEAVRIVDNRIRYKYSSDMSLIDTIKHELAFIEVPKETDEQTCIEFLFLNRKTRKPFRPPVFLVRPRYNCYYSDLSEQINQIQNHLCSISNAPMYAADHLYWINTSHEVLPLKPETNKDDNLLFMDRIIIEMDSEWIQKYQSQYTSDQHTDKSSLNSLLADFFREEPLDGDYYCSHCLGLKEARQKADLALPLPRVLIIQLKRFTYDAYSDTKINTYIDFPLTNLDLSQYVIQNSKKKAYISEMYDLVAVSNHTGTLVSGHYTTYAKNDQNKTWYSFNDEMIREMTDEKDVVTKNAYILVYVKRTC